MDVRIPPHNEDAEKAVLGALLTDGSSSGEAVDLVTSIVDRDDFYRDTHRIIYDAILNLVKSNKTVDFITLSEELERRKKLDTVGGIAYITSLANEATGYNIEEHARIIVEKAQMRRLIDAGNKIVGMTYAGEDEPSVIMNKAEQLVLDVGGQTQSESTFSPIGDVVLTNIDRLSKLQQHKGSITGVPTGFRDLDFKLNGLQRSDLILVAARPAMGKTSFALSIAKNIAVDYREPIAFFSLEMNNVQLVNRLISNVCSVPGNKILNGQLTPDEWERFDSNIRKMQGAPIYVDDTPGLSIFELRTKARRLVREHGIKILMIDYLQLMNANGMRFNSRQEEVSTISRSLKGLAKELNIPVLALSQLSRAVEQRDGAEGKRPQLSDLRESGAIEQDADMVLFVHRPEYYHILQDDKGNDLHGMAQIIIAKHRKGATGDVLLNFRGEYTRFANPEDTDFTAPLPEDQFGGEIVGSKINEDPMPPTPPGIQPPF